MLDAAARSGAEQGLQIGGVLPKPFTPADLRRQLQTEAAPATASAPLLNELGFHPDRQDLTTALARRELVVAYQPKVHCAGGQLAVLEALVRWKHPLHGLIGPDRFIPLAEEVGCIDELTL